MPGPWLLCGLRKQGDNMDAYEAFLQQSRRSFWFGLLDRLLRRCSDLLEFSRIVKGGAFAGQRDLGMQIIPVKQIIGTMGRGRDFDRGFRPRRYKMYWRWAQIHRLYENGDTLPVVELYKVGESYFVIDGHHRISVARAHGQTYIDAHVIEVNVQPLRPIMA